DTDVDQGDTKTVSAVNGVGANVGTGLTLASGAKLTMNANGSYAYDPNGQFEYLQVGQTTTDSFSYTVVDSHGATSSTTVTITITGVNDAPVAVADTGTTDEDHVLNVAAPGHPANHPELDQRDTKPVPQVNGVAGNVA